MAVQVEVRVVRLPLGFEQLRRVLQKGHAELMRAGGHRNARLQLPVHGFIILVSRRRHREQLHALPIQQQLQLVRLVQALDFFVPVPRQTDLDVVLAVSREVVRKHGAAARPHGKALHLLLLGEVRPNPDRVSARCAVRCADGQPADLLGCCDISIQQRRREISIRSIVKAVTHIVLGQQRCGIDIQFQ